MILEALTVGLVVSACFAVFIDEAVYSVAALAGTFLFTSALYASSGAIFVAVFQFAVGVGTLAILFLSGEMLGGKIENKPKPRSMIVVLVSGVLLSLPAAFLSVFEATSSVPSSSFGETLWNLRAVDVVLQGLVVLIVALGIGVVLFERNRKDEI